MLWDKALEGYWLETRRNLSPNTVTDYAGTFRRFRKFLNSDVQFEAITSDQVRLFLAYMADEGLSPKTVNNAWIALSSLWTWAEAELGTPHLLHKRIKLPKYNRPVIEPYPRTDIGALLNACSENAEWSHATAGK